MKRLKEDEIKKINFINYFKLKKYQSKDWGQNLTNKKLKDDEIKKKS